MKNANFKMDKYCGLYNNLGNHSSKRFFNIDTLKTVSVN